MIYYFKIPIMKPLIAVMLISLFFASCNAKTETNKDVAGIDSSGLYKNNIMADTARLDAIVPGTTTKRVVEIRNADGTVSTTTTTVASKSTSSVAPTPSAKTVSSGTNTVAQTTSSSSNTTATTAHKTGWSNRAKGAAIGGVGGAVVGAVVSKKKGKGALIGGIAGAAGGYIIGNEKDKKEGR